MKLSRKQVQRQSRTLPRLEFQDQKLTSFSGLVVFQALFSQLHLRDRLRRCFRHLKVKPAYDYAIVMLGLVVHLLLGYRRLSDLRYYHDDPMVQRLLGLKRLPNIATLSRMLANLDAKVVTRLREFVRELVIQRLAALQLRRITLNFDGSTLGTGRRAEGTAVGFNKKKKGQRSYYPLFCTIAQTGQVLDFLHRPGNVHDSVGAREFILDCIEWIRAALPGVNIELRMDSAFFSDAIVSLLHDQDVEFTISVPFARFVELKQRLEKRRVWWPINAEQGYFELRWKPKSWSRKFRFLAVRTRTKVQQRGVVQLDLFEPYVYGYQLKVVVTNKSISPRHVVAFHDGRGAQEGVFAELKSEGQMDYIPVRTLIGNQTYMLATILAHNLNRELQMLVRPPQRKTTPKRAPLWNFERLDTFRRKLLQRAGRLTQPQGVLTLTLSANEAVKNELLGYLEELQTA
ncbi:MAG: IS1380 family transposase [Gammaproteobacteria bacterium]|nr:IS1380 family transposase [Gammaproteobacteria bacterium]